MNAQWASKRLAMVGLVCLVGLGAMFVYRTFRVRLPGGVAATSGVTPTVSKTPTLDDTEEFSWRGGCGVVLVEIRVQNERKWISTGLETEHLFGRLIDADVLVRHIEKRLRDVRGQAEVSWQHKMTVGEYKTALSCSLLAQAREPRALDLLTRMLDDPYPQMRYWVAASLGELGDRRALPALCAALRSRKPINDGIFRALARIGDPAAVDVLLEKFDPGNPFHNEDRLKAVESLTGHRPPETQTQPFDAKKRSFEEVRSWWRENRERILQNAQTRSAASQPTVASP